MTIAVVIKCLDERGSNLGSLRGLDNHLLEDIYPKHCHIGLRPKQG